MDKYYLLFDDICDISIKDLQNKIMYLNKKIIGEIKLVDLIFDKQSMTGIYIIFDNEDKAVYVGKTGSRAILERLAGHFDLRPGAYMNTFLCALAGKIKQRKGPHATEEDLKNVYENALTHKMIFVQIPNSEEHKKKIGKLEVVLAKELKTKYNTTRGEQNVSTSTLIKFL
ncbi:GIY-YIG nuclease family protein [Hymenobacter cavernae]|uniref:GIY-YIG domain-containing protein n=1 Tax=Hymenobacter cavernae TaxID=2044852 RepID=A0ABQ1TZ05_9BACT|nr:GIY-YIG nuclease family protein [Hymenobacter cavernae]GGF04859.1 hypothetical protein GCM10011383_15020 [Hymenobacter cavernae]